MDSTFPTIREGDVSSESPYILMPSSRFVLGEEVDDGVIIHSQHRVASAAEKNQKMVQRALETRRSKRLKVYKVVRKEGASDGRKAGS